METSAAHPVASHERAGFKVAGTFFVGICIACYFGRRFPWLLVPGCSPWIPLLLPIVPMVLLCWQAWRWVRARDKADTEYLLPFMALALCWAPLQFFRDYGWAAPAAGVVMAAYAWEFARSRGRSWPIAVMGCLLAGTVALLVPWPNPLRLQLVFTCFGFAVALQGLWEIVRYLQGQRPEPASQPAASGFAWILFGNIEHVPITSSELDRRIRARYQTETAELERLGFSYLCSYSAAFSAFRLLLLLPAIAVLAMICKREVLRLGKGARIEVCYPLLTAPDNSAYAEASALGVKFYTAFADGSFRVSANYRSTNCDGPVMTKRWRVASIGELWTEHRSAIEALEAAGRPVDRRIDFRTHAGMCRREDQLM